MALISLVWESWRCRGCWQRTGGSETRRKSTESISASASLSSRWGRSLRQSSLPRVQSLPSLCPGRPSQFLQLLDSSLVLLPPNPHMRGPVGPEPGPVAAHALAHRTSVALCLREIRSQCPLSATFPTSQVITSPGVERSSVQMVVTVPKKPEEPFFPQGFGIWKFHL